MDYVYLWADGIHVNVRLEEAKLCLLVMIGVRADGRKELVALTDGYRESAESWADLLRDCRRRGMRAPVLAVGDGALGFWSALREVFPDTREQRCWFHKISNVLAALPKSAHPGAKKALAEIWNAEDKRHARDAVKAFEADLWREVSEGGRQDHRRRRAAAGVLRLPGRALDPSANHQSDRYLEFVRRCPRCPTRSVGVAGSACWTWLSAVVQEAEPAEGRCKLHESSRRSRRVSRGPFSATTMLRSPRLTGIWPICPTSNARRTRSRPTRTT